MLKRRYGAAMLSGLTVLCSTLVQADTATGGAETSAEGNSKSTLELISEKATLSYFGVYRGASLGDLGNAVQPDENGLPDPSSPQSIENYITTGYKLNPDLMVGAQMHFYYFPIGNPVGTGQDLRMYDPSLVVSQSNLINSNGFKLNGRLLVGVPLTNADFLRPNHYLGSIAPTAVLSYDVPHTDLSLGIFSYVRYSVPTADTPANAQTYKIYVAPNASYQLTKTLSATLWVDLIQATRNGGTGFISGLNNAVVDIEPGINWDITKNISFNPFINIYPSKMTLAATSVQAIIVAKAF